MKIDFLDIQWNIAFYHVEEIGQVTQGDQGSRLTSSLCTMLGCRQVAAILCSFLSVLSCPVAPVSIIKWSFLFEAQTMRSFQLEREVLLAKHWQCSACHKLDITSYCISSLMSHYIWCDIFSHHSGLCVLFPMHCCVWYLMSKSCSHFGGIGCYWWHK